jgi:hypothetical protein
MRAGVWAVAVLLAAAVGVRADEVAAVKAVEKLGGTVGHDDKAPGKPVVFVNLHKTKVTGLKELKRLKQLQALFLADTQVTDVGVKDLKELKQLQFLRLGGTKVTDAGIADLKQALPKLETAR